MKRVLFIIQSYPSERSANVLCDEKVMKELKKTGEYEIHALTYQYEWQKREDIINGFYIHRFKKSIFWDFYTWSRHHTDKPAAKLITKLHRLNLRLKQAVTIPFYPCYEPINSVLYAGAAIRLYKKYHFDLVFAEHNGYDTLYAGHRVKEFAGESVKFIATLWDPFTGLQTAKYLPKLYAQKKTEAAEAKILANADCIIAMHSSEGYHCTHSTRKPYYAKYRFLDIPGIVQPVMTESENNFTKPGMINFLYAGLLYLPDRDPSFLIDCINQVEWEKPVHLIFLCSGNGIDAVEEKKKTFKGSITIHKYVDQKELHRVMLAVDGFLNIGSDNPGMVPSKIFEYMSYGKPVISTYVADEDASREYLERYPLGICLNSNADSSKNISRLNDFSKAKMSQRLSFEEVATLFPGNTPLVYYNIIKELIR